MKSDRKTAEIGFQK